MTLTRSLLSTVFLATFSAVVILSAALPAQTAFADEPFPLGFVTLTFDDGWQSFADNAAPVLNAANLDATLYINTEPVTGNFPAFMQETTLQSMQTAGHDIGGHTTTHVSLVGLTAPELDAEIDANRSFLVGLGLTPVNSFAYPFGAYDATVIQAVDDAGYSMARTVDDGYNFADSDPLTLKIKHVTNLTSAATIQGWIDTAVADKTWLVLMFHEIVDVHPGECVSDEGGDDFTECTTTEVLQATVDHLANNDVCVITMAEAIAGDVSACTPATTTFTITATAGANGSITPSGAVVVDQGATQAFTITPASGFHVDTLTVDGEVTATSTSFSFANVQAAHTIAVTFAADTGGSGGGGGGVIPTCPANFTLTNGDCVFTGTPVTPTCPEGYIQDGTNCVPTAAPVAPNVCPEGYTLDGLNCVTAPVAPTCDEGLRFQEDASGATDKCISITPTAPTVCAEGAVVSNGECVVVAGDPGEGNSCFFPGSLYRADIDKCVYAPGVPIEPTCASPMVMNSGQCYVVDDLNCPAGTIYNDATDMCVQAEPVPATCPTGTTGPVEDLCTFVTITAAVCPAGYALTEGQCVGTTTEPTCPANMHVNEEGTLCVSDPAPNCPSGQHAEGYTCVNNPTTSSGGGGGGGGGGRPIPPAAVATTTGQVLGTATGSCFQFTRNLSRGMTGSDVMELQTVLKAKGFLVIDTPTMLYGPMTAAAVAKFQAANGLEQVGNVGPKTRALLNVCAGGMTDAQKQELIKALQAQLDVLLKKIAELIKNQQSGANQ